MGSHPRQPLLLGLSVVAAVAMGGCSSSPGPAATSNTASSTTVAAGTSGPAADVTLSSCKVDPTDQNQVVATGRIDNHASVTSDYTFTIHWFNGATEVTKASHSQPGVPAGTGLGWAERATAGAPQGGPLQCRATRVIRTPSAS